MQRNEQKKRGGESKQYTNNRRALTFENTMKRLCDFMKLNNYEIKQRITYLCTQNFHNSRRCIPKHFTLSIYISEFERQANIFDTGYINQDIRISTKKNKRNACFEEIKKQLLNGFFFENKRGKGGE